MSIYRGPITDAFHAARDAAAAKAKQLNLKPGWIQSDLDSSDETPYVMFMWETSENQREAEANGTAATMRRVMFETLGTFPIAAYLLPKVEFRIRNFEDHWGETWQSQR